MRGRGGEGMEILRGNVQAGWRERDRDRAGRGSDDGDDERGATTT